MKISYYKDTDTLYLEFKDTEIEETRELDEDSYLELDAQGNLVTLTLEHANNRADLNQVYWSGITVCTKLAR